jgi:chemotaxis protein CheC
LESALAEASNIIASACLSAMGGLTGQRLVPSVPTVLRDRADGVLKSLWPNVDVSSRMLALETTFVASLEPVLSGQLLVVPDRAGLQALLTRLGV